jgi:hypothetical protein
MNFKQRNLEVQEIYKDCTLKKYLCNVQHFPLLGLYILSKKLSWPDEYSA